MGIFNLADMEKSESLSGFKGFYRENYSCHWQDALKWYFSD